MRLLRLFALTLIALASSAAIVLATPGAWLGWDQCGADGAAYRCTSCNSNAGVNVAYGSFVPPAEVTALVGIEAHIIVGAYAQALPAWWQFYNPGSCRQAALSMNTVYDTGASACADYWGGHAAGGVVAYQPIVSIPPYVPGSRARIIAAFAIPSGTETPVDPETEYFAFQIRITNSNTVGTGACEGCSTPAAIWIDHLLLVQPAGVGDFYLTNPLHGSVPAIGWQGDWQGTPCIVPVKNRTWGTIKSMYR